ncbi:MAG TPA: M56 family metallopeptidase [Actinomycetota bacterium]|nr:M56 family metallopeptidase [Actinomycetota bacterium]
MTNPPPTIFALETDSAWIVILVVSLVTLAATLVLRRLIGRSGGLAAGILLVLPLLLPVIAAALFAHGALPEFSVLRPASPSLLQKSTGLLHLLFLRDGRSGVVTPYTLTGSAGPWLVLIGGGVTIFMLVRRFTGLVLVRRMITRSRRPRSNREFEARAYVRGLAREFGLSHVPELRVLAGKGFSGAFVAGARRPRILMSTEVIEALSDDELRCILAHEVAHLRTRDVQVVFSAGLLRDLVAWNPLGHIAFRRLAADRELEADRQAAAVTGRPLDVASGLLKVCELMRVGNRLVPRGGLAFMGGRGDVKRRVSNLLALADGGTWSASGPRGVIAGDRVGRMLYVVAGVAVAVLGLRAGAAIADRDLGGFAIVWGATTYQDTGDLWAPKSTRQHHGVANGKHKVHEAQRTARNAKAANKAKRPFKYPEFVAGLSLRERNVADWLRWMTHRARRVPPASLRWEGRQDWQMVPIYSEPGVGIRVYRLSDLSGWEGAGP